MRANGHPDAGLYPIGMVRDEARLVRKRVNEDTVLFGLMVQAAGMSIMAPKEGGEFFRSLIGSLSEE